MPSYRLLLIAVLAASVSIGCSRNLIHQAQKLESQGDDARALAVYEQALSHSTNAKQSADVLTRIGEVLYRMERIPDSFDAFQKAVEADPTNSLAHLRMGEMFLSAGSPDRARDHAVVVLNSAPNNTEALALIGAAWAASDNPEKAKQAYQRVLAADPKRVTVAVALADIYNRDDQVDRAREVLATAAMAQPASALPWLATGRLEEQEGNNVPAEQAYRKAVVAEDTPDTNFRLAQFLIRNGRVTEAEQTLRKVDSERRESPVALADFQLASGHPIDAAEQYESVLEAPQVQPVRKSFFQRLKPASAVPATRRDNSSIAARLIEAEIAAASSLDTKERTAALNTIRKRLDSIRPQIDPATAAILEAEIWLADNNLDLARMYANTATELAPNSASAHYAAGLVESAAGNDEHALSEWQAAIDNDAEFTPARLAMAEKALDRQDAAEADKQARFVVREDPGNFRGLIAFSRALLMQGKRSPAAIIAQRASVLDPSALEPTLLMGEIALQGNHLPDALMTFERAVVMHPDSDDAMNGLLRVYQRGTLSYAALGHMEQVGNKPPVSGTLLEIAGRLYAQRGWQREAIRALKRAVEVDPQRTTAARILAQLQLSTGDFNSASVAATRAGSKSESLLGGYQSHQSGDWKKAASQYERALHEGDQTGVAANNLAWIYAEHNLQLDRALGLAGTAAKASPNNPAVLDTLGFVLLKRREYTSAVKILEAAARLAAVKALQVEPEVTAQIRKHLSDAYFSAGQTEAAFQLAQNRGLFAGKLVSSK